MSNDLSHTPASPTVVVARRVHPGCDDAFRAWDRRIRGAAAEFPGYSGSEVQPPNPSHPGEWVTVYSFDTIEQLDTWIDSDERRALIAEVSDMVEGQAREQRIAGLRTAPEPVTVVFSQRVAPDNRDEFAALHGDVLDRLKAFEGFLGSDLLQPVEGVQDEHVIVASFASRADLDRWLESDSRHEWLTMTEQLVEGDRTVNVVGGFGGWFPAQPSQPQGPKRWKQSIAVFIALFPVSLLITLIRVEIEPNMNVVLGVFIGNVLGILALTYVLMPRVTHWLRNWLTR